MTTEYREVLWPRMMEMDGTDLEMVIERETVERGASFSAVSMEALYDELICFVGTRIMRRWDQTSEPPTALRVEISVHVQ